MSATVFPGVKCREQISRGGGKCLNTACCGAAVTVVALSAASVWWWGWLSFVRRDATPPRKVVAVTRTRSHGVVYQLRSTTTTIGLSALGQKGRNIRWPSLDRIDVRRKTGQKDRRTDGRTDTRQLLRAFRCRLAQRNKIQVLYIGWHWYNFVPYPC